MPKKEETKQKPSYFRPREAAKHLLEKIPTALQAETVATVQKRITDKKARFESLRYIYVLKKTGKLKGVLSLKELFAAPKRSKMNKFERKDLVVVHPRSPLQVATARAIGHNIRAIPVVDSNNKFLGIIGTDAILDTLEHEHVRDLLSVSGMAGDDKSFKNVLTAKVATIVKWRAPWLILGIAGGILTIKIVEGFQGNLEKAIELAFFIPVVLYMGAAVGNQTQICGRSKINHAPRKSSPCVKASKSYRK